MPEYARRTAGVLAYANTAAFTAAAAHPCGIPTLTCHNPPATPTPYTIRVIHQAHGRTRHDAYASTASVVPTNSRNAQVHAPNQASMMRLPPDIASPSRKPLDTALPAAITKHAQAPTACIAVNAWRNRGIGVKMIAHIKRRLGLTLLCIRPSFAYGRQRSAANYAAAEVGAEMLRNDRHRFAVIKRGREHPPAPELTFTAFSLTKSCHEDHIAPGGCAR